ncbi:MAG: HEAT repeat domain-containing protein [Blastocatellia bacterium]
MLCSVNISHALMALTLAVVLGLPLCPAVPVRHRAKASDADVKLLIDQLSTGNRAMAKTRLLEIGAKAAPQLISRLRDLTKFVEEPLVVDAAKSKTFDHYNDPEVRRRYAAWDTMEDCIELLGDLKSEEAVPSIIKVLEIRMESGREPKLLDEILALKEIGAPAVPALIDALARAPETARKRKLAYYPGEWLIQARMAFALAEIGDPRAIPALDNLIKIEPTFSRGFVADAIAKMEFKQQSR